jgi:hypothetical protein
MHFAALPPAHLLASAALALSTQPFEPQAPAVEARSTPIAQAPVSGLAWADFDVDGFPDLVAAGDGGQAVLLRNLGDGKFADVTSSYGLAQLAGVQGASWQDVDGDGLQDLLALCANGEVRLMRHFGAFFQDSTAQAGLSQSFAALEQRWLDYDLDGLADLLLVGADRQQLYHNLGQASFEAVDLPAPLDGPRNSAPRQSIEQEETNAAAATGAAAAAADVARDETRRAAPGGQTDGSTSADSTARKEPGRSQTASLSSDLRADLAAVACAAAVEDQAGGSCIEASSTPSLGLLYPLSPNLFVASTGFVGIGTTQPHRRLHVLDQSTGLLATGLLENVVVESADAVLGLFSSTAGTWGSALTLADVNASGQVVDKWAFARTTSSSSSNLHLTYGADQNYSSNPSVMTISKTGSVGIGTTSPGKDRLKVVHNSSTGLAASVTSVDAQNEQAALYVSHEGLGAAVIAISNYKLGGADGVLAYGESALHGIGNKYGVLAENQSPTGVPLYARKTSSGPAAILTSDSAGQTLVVIPDPAKGGEAAFLGGRTLVGYFGGFGLPVGRVELNVDSTNGGFVRCYNGSGASTILLDGDSNGKGRITTDVLEIKGGADLVESFDTAEEDVEPGTVLVIDSQRPGELSVASQPYDARVAGVVSGAGGISPGLHMGQEGVASGDTPVALTGRVYVKCTAENGAIRPGDRLTTSSLRGHAMRATDAQRADGAVIGKAMSALDEGTGLVLVLVNLQ